MKDTIELKPELLGKHLDKVQFFAPRIEITSVCIRITKTVAPLLIKYLLNQPKSINFSVILSKNDKEIIEIKTDERLVDNFQLVLKATSIEEFNIIPEFFEYDPLLAEFICPLTKKPIRYIVAIRGTEDAPHPIYFEKKAIQALLDTLPLVRPDAWPSELEFNHNNYHLKKEALWMEIVFNP